MITVLYRVVGKSQFPSFMHAIINGLYDRMNFLADMGKPFFRILETDKIKTIKNTI